MEIQKTFDSGHSGAVTCFAYNDWRRELYTGSQDATIRVFDLETFSHIRTLNLHKGWVTALLFVKRHLISASNDSTVAFFTEKGKMVEQLEVGVPLYALEYCEKFKLVYASGNGVIAIFKIHKTEAGPVSTGGQGAELKVQFLERIRTHSDVIRCVVMCNQRIWTASYDKSVRSYEPDKLNEPITDRENCHAAGICAITVDRELKHVVTGGFDGAVRTWSSDGKPVDSVSIVDAVQALCYVGASGHLWFSGTNSKVVVYDPRTGFDVTSYVRDTAGLANHQINLLHAPSQGDMVFGATPWKQIVVWGFNPKAPLYMLVPHKASAEMVYVLRRPRDPNSTLFTAGSDGTLKRWQPTTDAQTAVFECRESREIHTGSILAIVYHPECDFIITAGEDRMIRWSSVFSVTNMESQEGNEFRGHTGRITGLAVTGPTTIASAAWDSTIRFWDLVTHQDTAVISEAHRGPVHGITCAREREELASFGAEAAVRVWSTSTLALLYEINTHAASVSAVCHCAYDGAWVTGASDDVIRVWNRNKQQSTIRIQGEHGLSALFVDNARKVLLAAGRGRSIHILSLEAGGQELGCLLGHTDQVRAMVLLEERKQYVSVAWDCSMRFWSANRQPAASGAGAPQSRADKMLLSAANVQVAGEADIMGEFEKLHPLIPPRLLTVPSVGAKPQLKLLGKARKQAAAQQEAHEQRSATALGRRLEEAEMKLSMTLPKVENAIDQLKKAAGTPGGHHGGGGRHQSIGGVTRSSAGADR